MSNDFITLKSVEVEGEFSMRLLSNGIVALHWDYNLEQIEVVHLEKIRAILFEFGQGKKMPIYMSFDGFVAISKEARDDASTEEGGRYTLANAVHIDNTAQRLVFNLFMAINNPAIATKAFNNQADAFNWLLELKAERK